MRAGLACGVELAVHHDAPRAHALHIAGHDGGAVADVVAVRQRSFEHVAQDLHVSVAMVAEASARRDAIFVDDAQVAESHMRRVVVVGKRKTVPALQPAVVGKAAVGRLAQHDHERPPMCMS
jgi:Arc/MetJ family transcription regulator